MHSSDARAFLSKSIASSKGETAEANEMLAEFLELKPEWTSLARLHAAFPVFFRNPEYSELEKRIVEAGLLRADFPEE